MSVGSFPIDAISAASPDMNDTDMQALKDSIAKIGQQVPILIYQGRVIDGRKRLAACEALGISPIMTMLADDAAPGEYALALNILRTHYTASQRAAFAERIVNATRADGARIRDGVSGCNSTQVVSRRQAAEMFGVAKHSVARARRIKKAAAPEVMDAVERGHLTLHAAEQIATQVPHEDQPRVVEEVIREAKGKRNTPSKIINAAAPGKRLPPRRDVTVVRERSLQTIHACCTALDQFMDAPFSPESDFAGWQDWLREITGILTKFTRRMEKSRERSA